MTPLERLRRYISVWAQFDQIEQLTSERYSLEEIVDGVISFAGGFFAPVQIREEILEALREVQAVRPRYVVEVGTAGGGTLLLWSRVARPDATIVTIDLPGGDFGGGSSYLRVPLFHRLGLPSQNLHILRANSQDSATVERARECLNGNPADFLFIDADHTERGVRTDYALYSPLVRDGGMIAFHDIAITNPEYGVARVWAELKQMYRTRDILGTPISYGIGLLCRETHGKSVPDESRTEA